MTSMCAEARAVRVEVAAQPDLSLQSGTNAHAHVMPGARAAAISAVSGCAAAIFAVRSAPNAYCARPAGRQVRRPARLCCSPPQMMLCAPVGMQEREGARSLRLSKSRLSHPHRRLVAWAGTTGSPHAHGGRASRVVAALLRRCRLWGR